MNRLTLEQNDAADTGNIPKLVRKQVKGGLAVE